MADTATSPLEKLVTQTVADIRKGLKTGGAYQRAGQMIRFAIRLDTMGRPTNNSQQALTVEVEATLKD